MKLCDLTQFYSPTSGGVKRYLAEKRRFLRERGAGDEHVLIIPGERDACVGEKGARVYTVRSPLVSRVSGYRVLLRGEAVERILERERPDLIECGDPYQVGWGAVRTGAALGIPVVGFYHSHFPEAYLRPVERFVGRAATGVLLDLSRRYVRRLYNHFSRTIVPSPALGALLAEWGVGNIVTTDLGVDPAVFQPVPEPGEDVRRDHGIPRGGTLLLYVGRLAHEKNTHTLFAAFRRLVRERPGQFHLLVVGDGLQRAELSRLLSGPPVKQGVAATPSTVTHVPYCADARRLAQLLRAADLFVHPGVQETFGLVTLEAQACGTPVVGILGSYMDRIVHCGQAHWARENTAAALAAAVLASVRRVSPEDRAALHRTIAERYSWDAVFTRMFALYREVIATSRPQ